MDLDPIEAGLHRRAGRRAKGHHDRRDFAVRQFPRHLIVHLASGGMHLGIGDGQGAGPHRLHTAIEQRMAGAPAMPDLQKDAATGLVHRLSNHAPAVDLIGAIDAGFGGKAGGVRQHHGALADHQSGAGPLGVVLGHQGCGYMLSRGTAAGQGRHPYPVGQLQRSQGQGSEQISHYQGSAGQGARDLALS